LLEHKGRYPQKHGNEARYKYISPEYAQGFFHKGETDICRIQNAQGRNKQKQWVYEQYIKILLDIIIVHKIAKKKDTAGAA
jgi:hypothetical protein